MLNAHKEGLTNAIIFANRKKNVEILRKSLAKHGYNAGSLHGDMDQYARLETLEAFRDGKITYLVASDVAARGLDIPAVSHVFNYDAPVSPEDYVHRIGRTGRAGREGVAVTLVTPDDFRVMKAIEKLIGKDIPWEGHAPTEEEIEEASKRRRPARGGRGASASGKGRGKSRSGGGGARTSRGKRGRKPESGKAAGDGKKRDDAPAREQTPQPNERQAREASGKPAAKPAGGKAAAEGGSQAKKPPRGKTGRKESSGGKQRDAFHDGNMPAFLARPVKRD